MAEHSLSAEDRLDILQLFARYAWAYDDGDRAAYARCFTPDGVLAVGDKVLGRGWPQIEDALQVFLDLRGDNIWRHLNDHHLFEGGPDQASVRSYWTVVVTDVASGATGILDQGRYVTRVVKQDGRWLMQSRTFISHMALPAPADRP